MNLSIAKLENLSISFRFVVRSFILSARLVWLVLVLCQTIRNLLDFYWWIWDEVLTNKTDQRKKCLAVWRRHVLYTLLLLLHFSFSEIFSFLFFFHLLIMIFTESPTTMERDFKRRENDFLFSFSFWGKRRENVYLRSCNT